MEESKSAVARYYEVLRHAMDGDFQFEQFPFGEEINVFGPNESFEGFDAVRTMYPQFIHVLADFNVKEVYYAPSSACAIVEFFPVNGAAPILTAEWFHIRNGKIITITPIYDTAAWAKVFNSSTS